MKIGVFGDSFGCEYISITGSTNESWMQSLREKGYDVTTHGLYGTSVWYSYKKFLENFNNYTHIVFVYSSINRIHNLPESIATFSSMYAADDDMLRSSIVFNNLNLEDQEQLLKIIDVQRYIDDYQFNAFVCQNVFNNVNYLANYAGKKLVNVLPFNGLGSPDNFDLTNRTGSCITSLLKVSLKEMPNIFKKTWQDPRYCHLSLENNAVLADMILESFHSDSAEILDGIDRFVYSKEITKRYNEMIKTT